jgi:hypothetical protein
VWDFSPKSAIRKAIFATKSAIVSLAQLLPLVERFERA